MGQDRTGAKAREGRSEREIVLIGGGHSHIQVLDAFATDPPPDSRLTVVVDKPIAVYSGMVPGFVAGQYRAEELEIDAGALARRAKARLVVARAVGVDTKARHILVDGRDPVPYDLASFDIGSTVAGLDLPGVREHALPTRPISVFVQRIHELLEAARRNGDRPFRVIVVGAGAGGVELAFTLDARLNAVGARPAVVLTDAAPRILQGYSDRLERLITRRAARRGIEIRLDTQVTGVDTGTVRLEGGEALPYDGLVWVTGAVSHPVFAPSGLATDRRGFARVRPTLQVEHHDELFATGDCATLIEHPQTPKAGVYAVRQGPYITHNLRAALTGEPLQSYSPQSDFLTLLNLGDGTAVGAKWGFTISGRWVMTLKDWIDRRFMRRFQTTASAG